MFNNSEHKQPVGTSAKQSATKKKHSYVSHFESKKSSNE